VRLLFVTPFVLACACASTGPATVDNDQLARSIDALRVQLAAQDAKLEALQGRVEVLVASPPQRSAARDTRELEVVKLSPDAAPPAARRAPEPEEEEPVMLEITGEGDKLQIVKMPPAPRHKPGSVTVAKASAPLPAKADSSDATFAQAVQLYRDGKADDAFAHFSEIVKKNPKADKAGAALYWMGEARFDQRRYSEAIDQYKKLVDEYPVSSKSAEAMLKLGICYEKLGDANHAREAFQRLVDQHPQSAVAELARARPGVQGRSK
jgi:tol-pal system protein YbgF